MEETNRDILKTCRLLELLSYVLQKSTVSNEETPILVNWIKSIIGMYRKSTFFFRIRKLKLAARAIQLLQKIFIFLNLTIFSINKVGMLHFNK